MTKSWLEDLNASIKGEISRMAVPAQSVFRQVIRKPPVQSAQQKMNDFMNMPRAERQRLQMSMPPEDWQKYVADRVKTAQKHLGDGATGLENYFQGDAMPNPHEDFINELMQMVQQQQGQQPMANNQPDPYANPNG